MLGAGVSYLVVNTDHVSVDANVFHFVHHKLNYNFHSST